MCMFITSHLIILLQDPHIGVLLLAAKRSALCATPRATGGKEPEAGPGAAGAGEGLGMKAGGGGAAVGRGCTLTLVVVLLGSNF